jgi:uncharacterized membrane protein YeaQ/YmgE (transglycosylase-associated protein family)
MSPSYSIILWMVIGALAGWLAGRRRCAQVRARQHVHVPMDVGCVVAGMIGAVTGGALVELALRDNPNTLGVLASLLVALLGALFGQAIAPRSSRQTT